MKALNYANNRKRRMPGKKKRKTIALSIAGNEDSETSPAKRHRSIKPTSYGRTKSPKPPANGGSMDTIQRQPQHASHQTSRQHEVLPHVSICGTRHTNLLSRSHIQNQQPHHLRVLDGSQQQQQQQQPDIARLVPHQETSSAGSFSTANLHLLQCQVARDLLDLFRGSSLEPLDEASLARNMYMLWCHSESRFRAELCTHFDLVYKTLRGWLDERQATYKYWNCLQPDPRSLQEQLDCIYAMNELRTIRTKWKGISSTDGLEAEDLLCMAFRALTNMEGCETLYKTGLAHLNYHFLRSEDSRIIIPWETRVTSSNEGAPGTLTNPLHVDSNSGSNTATPLATPGPQTTIHRPASPHQEVASSTRSSGIANGGPREKTSIEVTKSRLVMLKVDRTRLSHLLTQGGHEGTETVSCHRLDHLHGVVAPMLDQRPMFLEDIEKKLSGQENITAVSYTHLTLPTKRIV